MSGVSRTVGLVTLAAALGYVVGRGWLPRVLVRRTHLRYWSNGKITEPRAGWWVRVKCPGLIGAADDERLIVALARAAEDSWLWIRGAACRD